MEYRLKELEGYKVVRHFDVNVSCQAPNDWCKECVACIYGMHYEKISADGLCDSDRKNLQEKKRLILRLQIQMLVALLCLLSGIIQMPITHHFWGNQASLLIFMVLLCLSYLIVFITLYPSINH